MNNGFAIISKIFKIRNASVTTNDNTTHTVKSVPIWKSRLSRRVAFAVFLTILTVQTTVMFLTIQQEEKRLQSHFAAELEPRNRMSSQTVTPENVATFFRLIKVSVGV